uniref:Solute carrier family 39 member 1 n=1 Tax=Molossus molossus TaxID=27622 RepID=A0A7J8CU12_MOLMO|nr:solute carrier family 39 member 1 [Molossus molossus]
MGPWGEPELLVWRPEAVASEPPVPVGLEVKLGALVLLLVLTLICSLVPICVLRRPGANLEASAFRHKALSLVSCFAAGVFLATCLLDLLPDYLSAIDEALAALHVTLQFPLQEFILAMGFFLVLVMEQITLAYKEQSVPPPREETRALLGTVNGGPQHWHDGPGVPQASGALAAPSALRACVLEGMAAGTFLYITFLEILPQELATSDQRILKVILLLSGFALLTGLLFIQV